MKTLALLACVLLMSTAPQLFAENPSPDASLCGPYPTNYKEIVMKWLETQLIDADSAKIEWNGEPKPSNQGTEVKPLKGNLFNFKLKAKNRFGSYTFMQHPSAFIPYALNINAFQSNY